MKIYPCSLRRFGFGTALYLAPPRDSRVQRSRSRVQPLRGQPTFLRRSIVLQGEITAHKQNEKRYEQKRRKCTFTFSDGVIEFLREYATSASSIERSSHSEPIILTQSQKESAANRTRTCDMLVNSQPLYQLSYGGTRISALQFLS